MEALALYKGVPTVQWEDNTGCISVVEAKRVTPRVKHIGIPVCFPPFSKNMKSPVSCQQICAQNRVQVL